MPSDKKLAAAAAHTRQQADVYWEAVDKLVRKVEKLQAQLVAAQAAVEEAQDEAERRQAEADDAARAAEGVSVNAYAEVAEIGMRS